MLFLTLATWAILPGRWWSLRRLRRAREIVRSAPWPEVHR